MWESYENFNLGIDSLHLQRNGKYILWNHLKYLSDHTQSDSGLFIGRRLTYEHLNLTSFSKMKVNLAAQVYIVYVLSISNLFLALCISIPRVLSSSVSSAFKLSDLEMKSLMRLLSFVKFLISFLIV